MTRRENPGDVDARGDAHRLLLILPAELWKLVRTAAKKSDTSVSMLVRNALKAYLEKKESTP